MKKETIQTTEVFKLDTGEEVSTLPLNVLKKVAQKAHIDKSNISLVSYGDPSFRFKSMCEVNLTCLVKNSTKDVSFVIDEADNQIPLLGLQE